MQRIRVGFIEPSEKMQGPVEVDETFIGGKRRNMSTERCKRVCDLGRGTAGKHVVVGIKDRATGKFVARLVAKIYYVIDA